MDTAKMLIDSIIARDLAKQSMTSTERIKLLKQSCRDFKRQKGGKSHVRNNNK